MKKILFIFPFLVYSCMFGFSQHLKNQDRILFERGATDTVYVLKEEAIYNLVTDSYGCIRKDSTICRSLAGILVIPADFEKQILDTCLALYSTNGWEVFKNEVKEHEYWNNYLYLHQNRGKERVLFSHVYKKERTKQDFFARTDYLRSLSVLVDADGVVSFKIKEWSKKKTWIMWFNFTLICLFPLIFLFLTISEMSILQISIWIPSDTSNSYYKELFQDHWRIVPCTILYAFIFAIIFGWCNGFGGRKDISEFTAFGDFLPMNIWKGFTFWTLLLRSIVIILPTCFIAFVIRFRQERKAMYAEFAGQNIIR